jgi:hypothetical protein
MQINDVPPTAMMIAVRALLMAPSRFDRDGDAPQKPCNSPYWSPNMATPFIDHSSEMWNFQRYRPLYPLSCSIRKV